MYQTPTLNCELQSATHSTNEVSSSLLPGIIKQRTNINFNMMSKMWDCNLLECDILNMGKAGSSEMLVPVYKTAQHHIPKGPKSSTI